MTVEIKYNGEIQEIIEAKNAYVSGLNLSDDAERGQTLNIDELQFDKPYVFLK